MKFKKCLMLGLGLSLALSSSLYAAPINEKQNIESISTDESAEDVEVKDSTEENFLKSLAEKEGISVEEARELNNQMIADALQRIHGNKPVARMATETIKYKQVEKSFKINDDITIIIATEAEYVFDRIENRSIELVGCGNPYVGVEGWSDSEWSGSDPNISKLSTSSTRISVTGQAKLSISTSLDAGIDLAGFSFGGSTSGTSTYYSPVKTYTATVYLSGVSVRIK